jgi:membrane protein YqaA with SNARE-associated domain
VRQNLETVSWSREVRPEAGVSAAAIPTPEADTAPTAWSRIQRFLPLILSLLATMAVVPLAYVITRHAGDLRSYGLLAYPVVCVVQALTSATLFLPAPGAALAAAAGTFLDPFWVGIFAGVGSATGELTGYGLGYYGRRAVPTSTSRMWRLAERGFRRWGVVSLIALALIPNPFFDALGILAGCLRYPLGRYWLATATGKMLKFYAFAYGGSLFTTWMTVAP